MEIGLGNKISASIGILFTVPCSFCLLCSFVKGGLSGSHWYPIGVNNTDMWSGVYRLIDVAVTNKHRNM
jgi:hypothetical protein